MAALKNMSMAKLNYLTNEDKAKILHKAFYSEIPAFIRYVEKRCADIQENKTEYAAAWELGLFTFDYWLTIVKDVEDRIKKDPEKIACSRAKFAKEIFGDLRALFSNYCLIKYIKDANEKPDEKFRDMVLSMYDVEL